MILSWVKQSKPAGLLVMTLKKHRWDFSLMLEEKKKRFSSKCLMINKKNKTDQAHVKRVEQKYKFSPSSSIYPLHIITQRRLYLLQSLISFLCSYLRPFPQETSWTWSDVIHWALRCDAFRVSVNKRSYLGLNFVQKNNSNSVHVLYLNENWDIIIYYCKVLKMTNKVITSRLTLLNLLKL